MYRATPRLAASLTYGHMAAMPRLPVPPLSQTCELYLRTLRPLVSAEELEQNKALVADFTKPGGVGHKLHGLLVEYAAKEYNWLEKWWDYGYLDIRTWGGRDPGTRWLSRCQRFRDAVTSTRAPLLLCARRRPQPRQRQLRFATGCAVHRLADRERSQVHRGGGGLQTEVGPVRVAS